MRLNFLSVGSSIAMANGYDVVVPHFGARQGHPVGFTANCFNQLAGLVGERGAASIVRAAHGKGRVKELQVDDEGIVTDIDTLEDLKRAESVWRSRQPS